MGLERRRCCCPCWDTSWETRCWKSSVEFTLGKGASGAWHPRNPLSGSQPWDAGEFAQVAGDQRQAARAGLAGDEDVVGTNRRPLGAQERPDFAWFSMPLIQMLTLRGFAVFVPNVRGSSGYGMEYMKKVERDWGGDDRLDHAHAMTEVLPKDPRIDVSRAAVVGRSYGGYMTLIMAFRHPNLWSAAIDMFGPYDLFTFIDRLPPTWQPYFKMTVGDPEKDQDELIRMSPKTYMQQLECPMLVIQGANDPRVVEQESRDVVEQLQAAGKDAEIYVFEDEGHDVIKYPNRVKVYNMIVEYFEKHLKP